MMLYFVSVLLGTLLIPALALTPSSSWVKHVIHEKRDTTQRKWVERSPLDPDHIIPARIGLKQSNLDLGVEYLYEISDPKSSRFGHHYTINEVTNLFAPTAATVEIVKSWIVDSGIRAERISQSSNKAWLQFDASIEEMQRLLQTKYHYYEHVNGGPKHIGCENYKVPEALSDHIDYVTPGVKPLATRAMGNIVKRDLASLRSREQVRKPIPADVLAKIKKNTDATDDCPTAMTPACIRALYNITVGTLSNPTNSLGIFSFGSVYTQVDLDMFFETYSPNIPKGTHPQPVFIDGATAPGTTFDGALETELDFEIAYPIVFPQTTTDYQTNYSQFNLNTRPGIFNTFLDAIDGSYCTYSSNNETGDDPNIDPVYPGSQHQCGVYVPTNVISLSYGLVERDYPDYYQIRQCNEFMKLALQGVTIVAASGDDGVADSNNARCLGPNGNAFVPNYLSCPYITLVGATELPSESSRGSPETAPTVGFASGGGFSNIFAQPRYQEDAVNSFFTNHNPAFPSYSSLNGSIGENGGIYNRIGRGYPDVSANGVNGALVYSQNPTTKSGTSMSTPLVAAIFTRINDERLAAGKSPIGFVNPTLYANPQMFNDVTVGNQYLGSCGPNFFSCVEGWDPVTCLGTPKYDAWLQVFMALQ